MSTEPATTPAPRRRGLPTLLVVLGLLIVVGIWFVTAGNRLVALQENVNTSWAQVETVLQRRFDLIPNLVNTVKGYAEHEKEILEEVTRLRSQWGQAKTVDEKAKAGSELEGVLSRLLVVSENYPDLKANQNFRDLQVELSGTENRVAVERERYNEVVRTYNTAVRQFPASLVASVRGFTTDKPYFEGSRSAQEAPKVDFSKPEK
ncbi:MAG TPA: LemA family protein [Planctomycetaceae bacterium]|jgi:LemA protein|nr:LemA family protein [Planctomycetaceae bacterium]